MGDGGADDAAVERAAVRSRSGRLAAPRLAVLALLAAVSVSGCKSIGDIAGVTAAAGSGSASVNPAVGIAVGIAVRSGVNALVDYLDRRRHQGEQDAIAAVAGAAPVGTARAWEIRHTLPIGNEHGFLQPVREIVTPLTTCREIAFTVVDGDERDLLTTMLCREADGWRWALAEPAVARWGALQ